MFGFVSIGSRNVATLQSHSNTSVNKICREYGHSTMRYTARNMMRCKSVLYCCGDSGDGKSVNSVADGSSRAESEALFLTQAVPGDELVRTISANGQVACKVVKASGLVSGSCSLFRTSPVASAALGRALVCTLLLSTGKKDRETVNIEFRCSGPIKSIVAIANGLGEARGYVGDPKVVLPPNADGKLDVGKAVGKGILAVIRNHPFWKQPYTGLVAISSGEVAEDIAQYLADSEQTPSALGAGVYVNRSGLVEVAGGYLVELLPGCEESTIELVERNIAELGMTPTQLFQAGFSAEEIVEKLMRDLNPMALTTSAPRYKCTCAIDRVKRTIALIKLDELKDLLEKEGRIEAACEFCGRVYYMTPEEALDAHAQASTPST